MYTAEQSEHTTPKPFWTTWRRLLWEGEEERPLVLEQWPLCCQKDFDGDWSQVFSGDV